MRRSTLTAALIGCVTLIPAAGTSAHGLVERADLPLPAWLFQWGAALVLVVSFAALAAGWSEPKLQDPQARPLPRRFGRALTHPVLEGLLGAVGFALLVLVVIAGFTGTADESANLAPNLVYVGFWVGMVPVSVLFGDVFRVLNPWRAAGRAVGRLVGSSGATESLQYPRRLGYWPAAAGLLAFATLELVVAGGADPQKVAVATLVYSAAQWIGMALFGVEAWSRRGDGFGVYFGLLARMSIWRRDGRRIQVRPPLSGLPSWPVLPGAVAVITVLIGTVTWDGASEVDVGQRLITAVRDALADLGLGPSSSLQIGQGVGLIAAILGVSAVYALGMAGVRTVRGSGSWGGISRAFVHTFVPIALAYAAAHYLSLFAYDAQRLIAIASDPLSRGWDLFGTADRDIDFSVISTNTIWYLQVLFVLAGHIAAVALAHDRALAVYRDARAAIRSQYWLLALMVGFTLLALYLLYGLASHP